MQILNKPFYKKDFISVKTIEDIKKTPSNSIIYFKFNLEMAIFCNENQINYGIITYNIKEALFAINLNTNFIMSDDIEIAKKFQKIVEDYVLDTKVVLLTEKIDENIIDLALKNRIDALKEIK